MAVNNSYSFKRTLLALAIGLSSTSSFATEQTGSGATEQNQEELTIVIVKKPGKSTKPDTENDSSLTSVTEFSNHSATEETSSSTALPETSEVKKNQAPIIAVTPTKETESIQSVQSSVSEASVASSLDNIDQQITPVSEAPVEQSPTEASDNTATQNLAIEETHTSPEDNAVDTPQEATETTNSAVGIAIIDTQTSEHLNANDINAPITDFTIDGNGYSDDYYGNYIPPQRQIDSYYSSDITEAINANSKVNVDEQLHVASVGIPSMARDEMSDLVVEGALDATAAGDVSTTTLKSAVVIPDDSIFEELEPTIDEDAEEINEALTKKDLSRRVKEALELLGQTQNHAGSTGNATAGTMTASGVRVTATISSRATSNSFTEISNNLNGNF